MKTNGYKPNVDDINNSNNNNNNSNNNDNNDNNSTNNKHNHNNNNNFNNKCEVLFIILSFVEKNSSLQRFNEPKCCQSDDLLL